MEFFEDLQSSFTLYPETVADFESIGKSMYTWMEQLYPLCRSITGRDTLKTLIFFKRLLPRMKIVSVPSGTYAYDWQVPDEWNITDAYIETLPDRTRILSFKDSNLHVVGYSTPIDKVVSFGELQEHLHSLPDLPDAIPYITSYYKPYWGFCIQDRIRQNLRSDISYHVKIESTIHSGNLHYGELIIQGDSDQEVLLSTYCCHPSLANNELSGPCLTAALACWLQQLKSRRILFLVETIGSIVYLSKNLDEMQRKTIAGFVITCVGDNKTVSFSESREGTTYADKVALHILNNCVGEFNHFRFLDNGGSDDRQYCSPKVDLPVASIMRSAYGQYPEYHTSLDNLEFVSEDGLHGSFSLYTSVIRLIESNEVYSLTNYCEPQLGKRGLYPSLSTAEASKQVRLLKKFLAYTDGKRDLIDIADRIGCSALDLLTIARKCLNAGVISKVS